MIFESSGAVFRLPTPIGGLLIDVERVKIMSDLLLGEGDYRW